MVVCGLRLLYVLADGRSDRLEREQEEVVQGPRGNSRSSGTDLETNHEDAVDNLKRGCRN
jgi:hypothetical protein